MSDWKDSAEEIAQLVLRYLRPMVEASEKQREQDAEREALRSVMGEESRPPLAGIFGAPFTGGGIDLGYMYRAVFAFTLDGSDALMRDDGSVWMWSPSQGIWVQHSALPGTPSARPTDDAPEA